jgi:hypothetical protein
MATTTSRDINFKAPALPYPPDAYNAEIFRQFNNILRIYFNQIDNALRNAMAVQPISFIDDNVDAFGRLVTTQPYTLFDSQNRYATDPQFDTALTGGGTTTYLPNESTVRLDVGTASGDEVVRQTFRNMPYQPGKGLTLLATFVMGEPKTNLRQRVGYFNTENGVFLQQDGTDISFVLRSSSLPTPGTPSDVRTVPQSEWNVDKMDGRGPSGRVLDLTKNQILWMDFEWLGTGDVRVGFYVDGRRQVCHIFHNDNEYTAVYMTTAILPVRYEITNTGTTASSSSFKQVCSSVINMGGYEETSAEHVARRTSILGSISTTFLPLISIRMASSALGSVILPYAMNVLPTTNQNYEIALFKNPTLTGASWSTVSGDTSVEEDSAATAMSGGDIVFSAFTTSSTAGGTNSLATSAGYNWDLQLGASLAGVSDIYTLAVRTVSGATTGDVIGSLSFYDITR